MAKRVDPPFDVASLMEHGDQFHYAMTKLGDAENPEFPMLATPFVVCASFALECYFKVLTNIERNLMPLKTHDLKHLFADFSLKTQTQLAEEWVAKVLPIFARHKTNKGLPPNYVHIESFRQALEISSLAFVDWRYGTKADNRAFHLPDLVPMARSAILDIRPDLATKRQVVTLVDPSIPFDKKYW